jgi:transposase
VLDPYKPYLVERWNTGCHVGAELVREIQAHGYQGGRSIAMDFVAAIRKQQGLAPMKRTGLPPQTASDPSLRAPTPRELTWVVLKRPVQRDVEEQAQLMHVQQAEPKLAVAITLAQEFAVMVRERDHERLDSWLKQAESSGLRALKSFAAGIWRDYAAVSAGLRVVYSNGVVEGNVNRLKYLKRQMYGRANFDLLRKRVLYAA